jgi:hypothetical protein
VQSQVARIPFLDVDVTAVERRHRLRDASHLRGLPPDQTLREPLGLDAAVTGRTGSAMSACTRPFWSCSRAGSDDRGYAARVLA